MHIVKTLYLLFISTFLSTAFGQQTDFIKIETKTRQLPFGLSEQVSKDIPTVALALSGGGARGLAQIGILKAFNEDGIQIDEIVGTSMGSIVGGLYASGYSVNELDSIARNIDWASLISLDNKTNRRDLFVDQKITEDKAVLSLRLDGLKPIIPTSINDGQSLSNQLNLLTLQAPIHVKNNFDNMLYKFSAVCTDLVTGEKVVLNKGSLSLAMRASSSVSFLLSPTKYDSLILVDGGLVENIPVNTAIDQGADFVIAVNTTSELHLKDDLEYPWLVADQVVSIPMKLLNETQLNSANFILQPSMPNIDAGDFLETDSIIEIGYKTAKQKVGSIKASIDSIVQSRCDKNNYYLQNISIIDDEVPEFANALKSITTGKDLISKSDIARALNDIFKTGIYQNLQAKIDRTNDTTSIEISAQKKSEVKSYSIAGMEILDRALADSILSELLNKPFVEMEVVDALLKVLKLYRNQGYSLADVTGVFFDQQIGQLQIKIDEGKISKIIIEGNERTSETIIIREFPIREGDYFLYKNIEEGLTNLRSTGLFNDVVFSVVKEGNKNVVSLQVTEKVSGVARIGFRSDNENKTQLSLDVRDENLFGSGTEIGALMILGSRNRSFILEQKSNRLWNTYLTYKINAYHTLDDAFLYNDDPATSENKFTRSAVGEYRQIYYGISLALGTQVERFGNLILQGKYEINQVKNKTGSAVLPYKIKVVSLKISTTIDTQDKYPYPRNGFLFYGSYETAQKVFGGEVGYTNLFFNYKNYFTFEDDHTISPRISLGFGDKTLPLSQQYSLGGQYSFFGMRDEEFRGRQLFLASLEYRYDLPVDLFFDTYLSLRYDLGSIWVEQEAIRFKDLRHGVGASISLDTPIGPADFAVGRSFLFKKNLPGNPLSWGEVFFYFSIGYYF